MITASDIYTLLQGFHIKPSDTVLMHTSLKKIGGIDGGAEQMLSAFTEYLHDGLYIVPTHTWANVNADNPRFDVRETMPCIGAYPSLCAKESFKRKDAVRSLHPTHSVAAFGKRAHEFVLGEEKSKTPTPVGGVWSRLYDEKAKILLVGVGFNRNTYLHAIDEELDIPRRILKTGFDVTVVREDRSEIIISDFAPHCSDCSEFFPNFEPPLKYIGAVSYGKLGNAVVICCDTVKMHDAVVEMWKRADYDLCTAHGEIPTHLYTDIK